MVDLIYFNKMLKIHQINWLIYYKDLIEWKIRKKDQNYHNLVHHYLKLINKINRI
jgi:hypothetical protein